MTPERLTTIRRHVVTCTDPRELAGLYWGLREQGEVTGEVMALIATVAKGRGWWPLPSYDGRAGASDDRRRP